MGNKQNPLVLRLSTNAQYASCWFAKSHKEYRKFVKEDYSIRTKLNKKLSNAGVGSITLKRAGSNRVIVDVESTKPGVMIGPRGRDVDALRDELKAEYNSDFNINVQEIRHPDAHALCVANKIAQQLVARGSWRKLMKTALNFGMKSGLNGMSVECSGRLSAIARTEKKSEGRVPLSTFRANIKQATVPAVTRSGVIGVRVTMSYSDKVKITTPIKPHYPQRAQQIRYKGGRK